MVSGTVSSPELDWMIIAFLGLVASVADWVLAGKEAHLHWGDGQPIKGIAISGFIKSTLLFMMTLIGIVIGAVAVMTPEPTRPGVTFYLALVTNGLIIYQALLVLVIVVKDWERWYVQQWEWRPIPSPDHPRHHYTPLQTPVSPVSSSAPCPMVGEPPCKDDD